MELEASLKQMGICNCMVKHDSTWLDQMGEDQSSQSKDCYCSEKASENQLEKPFMVELDELCWLRNGSM